MNYSLTIQQQQGQQHMLTLSGHLTIRNSFALHAELLEFARLQEGLRLEVKDVEDLDATFLQLLLSLSRYLDEHQKSFYLHLDLNPNLSNLLDITGVPKILNTNPL